MALVPVLIYCQSLVEKTKGQKSFVSTSYFAKFADGSEKILNRKQWLISSLLRSCDLELIALDSDVCHLYYCDWSKNPLLGKWENNFPPSLIPKEIFI